MFKKEQTVRLAAIIENKRLRYALAIVRGKQEQRQTIKIMANSEKVGYQKRGRKMYQSLLASSVTAPIAQGGD
jgi:hypothetical protein